MLHGAPGTRRSAAEHTEYERMSYTRGTRNNALAMICGILATLSAFAFATLGPTTNANANTATGWTCVESFTASLITSTTMDSYPGNTGYTAYIPSTSTLSCSYTGGAVTDSYALWQIPYGDGWVFGDLYINGSTATTITLSCSTSTEICRPPGETTSIAGHPWADAARFEKGTTPTPMDCSALSFLQGVPALAGYPSGAANCEGYADSTSYMTMNFGSGTQYTPCSLLDSYNSYPNAQPSTSYAWNMKFAGAVDKIVVDPMFTTTMSQTIDGHNFTADAQEFTAPSSPLDTTITTPSTFTPNTALLTQMWCEYAGTWTQWFSGNTGSSGNSPPDNNTGGTFDLQSCFASSGMSLYNPVSWVTGAIKDGICVGQWLFIPSSNNNTSSLLSSIESKPPLSDISDAVSAATTMINAINTSATANTCSPPTLDPFSQSSGYLATLAGKMVIQIPVPADVCGGTLPSYDATVGEVFGYRTFFRAIEALGIWLATLAILWKMMPWARRGDGVEVVTAIGHAGGMTLYSDGTATED